MRRRRLILGGGSALAALLLAATPTAAAEGEFTDPQPVRVLGYDGDGRFGPHPLPEEADLVIAEKRGQAFVRRADSDDLLARVNSADLEYAPAISPPPASSWGPERRLTRQGALWQTTLNFARSVAADARGRVHVVWTDERDEGRQVDQLVSG